MDIGQDWFLVTGVSGNVGHGIARAVLERGGNVVGLSRDAGKAARFLAEVAGLPGRAVTVVGDPSDDADVLRLRDEVLEKAPRLRHVAASLGPWWQKGPVVEQSAAEYRTVLRDTLDAQVFLARAFIPVLKDTAGASYTVITGQGGHAAIPGSGLLVIAVNGVFGLSRMLRVEHERDLVKVNEILISARIEREPRPRVIPALTFGQAYLSLVEREVRSAQLTFRDAASFTAALDGK